MALLKDIIDKNGVKTSYHRIGSVLINKDLKRVQIVMKRYSNEKYRLDEKKYISKEQRMNEKQELLSNLIINNSDGSQNEKIKELTEEINKLTFEEEELFTTTFVSEEIEEMILDVDGDYSLRGVYEMLKKEEKYNDSKDI